MRIKARYLGNGYGEDGNEKVFLYFGSNNFGRDKSRDGVDTILL